MLEIGLSGQMFDDLTVWDHLDAASSFGYTCVELRSTHVNPEVPMEELKKIRSTLRPIHELSLLFCGQLRSSF